MNMEKRGRRERGEGRGRRQKGGERREKGGERWVLEGGSREKGEKRRDQREGKREGKVRRGSADASVRLCAHHPILSPASHFGHGDMVTCHLAGAWQPYVTLLLTLTQRRCYGWSYEHLTMKYCAAMNLKCSIYTSQSLLYYKSLSETRIHRFQLKELRTKSSFTITRK